jgi:hypothetical protein
METDSWWIGFASPAVCAIVNILMWVLLLKKDSLYFLVEKGGDDDALFQFKKVYTFDSSLTLETEWQKLKQSIISSTKPQKQQLVELFTDRRFKDSTILMLKSAVFNQCSGISIINIYSASILANIPSIPTDIGVYCLALANVIGAAFGPTLKSLMPVRNLLIAGQFINAFNCCAIMVFAILDMPLFTLLFMVIMVLTF